MLSFFVLFQSGTGKVLIWSQQKCQRTKFRGNSFKIYNIHAIKIVIALFPRVMCYVMQSQNRIDKVPWDMRTKRQIVSILGRWKAVPFKAHLNTRQINYLFFQRIPQFDRLVPSK